MVEMDFAKLLDLASRLQEAGMINRDIDLARYIAITNLVCHMPAKRILLSLLLRGSADL